MMKIMCAGIAKLEACAKGDSLVRKMEEEVERKVALCDTEERKEETIHYCVKLNQKCKTDT